MRSVAEMKQEAERHQHARHWITDHDAINCWFEDGEYRWDRNWAPISEEEARRVIDNVPLEPAFKVVTIYRNGTVATSPRIHAKDSARQMAQREADDARVLVAVLLNRVKDGEWKVERNFERVT